MRDNDDLAVDIKGDCFSGKKILFGITGGIAASESIKLIRELRRFQPNITIIMTKSAQKIITPLAVSWAGNCEIITDWEHQMSGLSNYDGILVSPCTRNFLSKLVSGVIDSPLMMAIAAAEYNNIPVMIVPSMHQSLADNEKTQHLCNQIEGRYSKILWGEKTENKYKQPNSIEIVANFANHVNSYLKNRKNIVVTLGSTTTMIDDIRYVKNTSSGETGYEIASRLFRWGHDVTIVAGETNHKPEFNIPLEIKCPNPEEMLKELIALSKCSIDVWIHAAAVLDYIHNEPIIGKIASGSDNITFSLTKYKKHLIELEKIVKKSFRVAFKLESNITLKQLISKSSSFVVKNNLDAVIANRLEDLNQTDKNRAHLILRNGDHFAIPNLKELSNAIRQLIDNN